MTNSGAAVPWSVPTVSLRSGRRPNSENVIIVTRLRHVLRKRGEERVDRAVDLGEVLGVAAGLVRVGVEAADRRAEAPGCRGSR